MLSLIYDLVNLTILCYDYKLGLSTIITFEKKSCYEKLYAIIVQTGAKTIKKNTNSTQNKSQTHRTKQYEVTSFLSTDCE